MQPQLFRLAPPLASFLISLGTHAEITGKVVAVAYGDTITVLRDHEQIKVRLTEIDAPEKALVLRAVQRWACGP